MMQARRLPSVSDLEPAGPRAELLDPAVTVRFMLAGDAHVTFQSRRTGARFTYRVESVPPTSSRYKTVHYVGILTGSDNSSGYSPLGIIFDGKMYAHGFKSSIAKDAPSAVAFAWVWRTLTGGRMHDQLAVYHEGRCGRCGRRLTTPRSIEIGLGPTCESKGGL